MLFFFLHWQYVGVFGIGQPYLRQTLSLNSCLFKVYPNDWMGGAFSHAPTPLTAVTAVACERTAHSATKRNIPRFRGKRTPIPNAKIKLNGVQLFATDHIKYVGITFDEHLTF